MTPSEFFEFEEEPIVNFLPINEGKDHINIYSKSRLELGRQLSNFYHSPFISSIENEKFESIEGYWYWIKTGKIHNELKSLYGFKAKQLGKTLSRVHMANFNELILSAINDKLIQNEYIFINLINSTLPLTHYYFYGEISNPKIHNYHEKYKWIIDHFEQTRKCI